MQRRSTRELQRCFVQRLMILGYSVPSVSYVMCAKQTQALQKTLAVNFSTAQYLHKKSIGFLKQLAFYTVLVFV